MTKTFHLTPINDFTFNLKINGEHYIQLYYIIQKLIKNAHIDYESKSIIFSAEHISSFDKYISIHNKLSHLTCIKLIDNLSTQIFYLKQMGFGFYGFDIKDILSIDGLFILCSTQYILPLYDEKFIFTSPITLPYFSNPELFKLTSLPFEINYKCSFYSLGLLIVFALFDIYLLVGNELKSQQEIDNILQPIHNTKLYWFLKRCFNDDIHYRQLLLI